MESFVRSHKATLVALAVFIFLAWLVAPRAYSAVTQRACAATTTYGYLNPDYCTTQLRWVNWPKPKSEPTPKPTPKPKPRGAYVPLCHGGYGNEPACR